MAINSPKKSKRKSPPVSLIERDSPILDSSGGFVPFKADREDYELPDDLRASFATEDDGNSLIVDLSRKNPLNGKSKNGSVIKTLHDGSIEVSFNEDGSEIAESKLQAAVNSDEEPAFDANLAEYMSESDLSMIAMDILEMIDADIQANAPWDKRFQSGLKILGVNPPAASELPFTGAASINHPIIAEAIVQFNARSYPELMPPTGPVKSQIVGQTSEDNEKAAERVEKHMNYQIMHEDECYPEEMDQLLFYLPLAGSAFKKTYFDSVLGYTTSRFVRGEDVIVPYNATSLESSSRHAIRIKMVKNEMRKKQLSGFYRDVELIEPSQNSSHYDSQSTLRDSYDKADGRTEVSTDKDGLHFVYETYIEYNLKGYEHKDENGEETGLALPYIITVERESQKVLAIRRNYREDTPMKSRRYLTHYKYLPGVGCKGFGLVHAMGGIAETLTGSIRALLDSASFATLQGGFKSKDARLPAGGIELRPGTWTDVDLTAEELKNAFFTPPFKEPSMALFKLMEGMEQNGRRYLGTTETAMGDAPANGPVGTTVALIEQSTKVMSGIHRRLHRAQSKEFKIRAEINAEFLPEGEIYFNVAGGNEFVTREDYANRQVDIVPVSDPNIVSSTQRIAIAQSIKQLALESPQIYDKIKVEEKILRAMGVTNPDELLVKDEELPRCDPATEGSRLLAQKKIKAFYEQNHMAHEAVHMAQIEYYKTLPDQQVAQALIMQMMDHIAKHKAYAMYAQTQQLTQTVLPEIDLYSDDTQKNAIPPEIEYQISEQMAQMVGALIQEAQAKAPPPAEDVQAKAKVQREDMIAQAEEARKQKAYDAEEERKRLSFNAEQERKGMMNTGMNSMSPDDYEAEKEMKRREDDRKERELRIKEEDQRFRHSTETEKLDATMPDRIARQEEHKNNLMRIQDEWRQEREQLNAEREAERQRREEDRQFDREQSRQETAAVVSEVGRTFAEAIDKIMKQNTSAMAKIEVALQGIAADQAQSTNQVLAGLKKVSDDISTPKTIVHDRDADGNITKSTVKIDR